MFTGKWTTAKAWVAALTTIAGAIAAAFADGKLTPDDTVPFVVAILTIFGVYKVPNNTDTRQPIK